MKVLSISDAVTLEAKCSRCTKNAPYPIVLVVRHEDGVTRADVDAYRATYAFQFDRNFLSEHTHTHTQTYTTLFNIETINVTVVMLSVY